MERGTCLLVVRTMQDRDIECRRSACRYSAQNHSDPLRFCLPSPGNADEISDSISVKVQRSLVRALNGLELGRQHRSLIGRPGFGGQPQPEQKHPRQRVSHPSTPVQENALGAMEQRHAIVDAANTTVDNPRHPFDRGIIRAGSDVIEITGGIKTPKPSRRITREARFGQAGRIRGEVLTHVGSVQGIVSPARHLNQATALEGRSIFGTNVVQIKTSLVIDSRSFLASSRHYFASDMPSARQAKV